MTKKDVDTLFLVGFLIMAIFVVGYGLSEKEVRYPYSQQLDSPITEFDSAIIEVEESKKQEIKNLCEDLGLSVIENDGNLETQGTLTQRILMLLRGHSAVQSVELNN